MNTNRVLLAIDFDGCIAYDAWPGIGKPKPNVARMLTFLKNEGCEIIIWTCRHGQHAEDAKKWLKENNIPYDYFNEHHPTSIEMYNNDTRKISADIYIDDRNLGGIPDDWFDIYVVVKDHIRHLKTKHFDTYEQTKAARTIQGA